MTTIAPSAPPAFELPGYTLTRPLAEGGMAEVFVAVQHSLGREVAVKIVKAGGDPALAERFQREARLVATLNHSHIVHIYDVGQLADGRPYLSMELLPGGDLRQRIRDGLKGSEILRIMRQLAAGLAAIHERGIVHRDIKPANILFRENGDAVLTDFGIAKAPDIDVTLTQVGVMVGSPAYSSPEQIGSKPLDGRSDLYSLGVVLVEMLTGRNPFRGPDYASTVANQLQESAPMLPAWHAPWQPVVDRLLAKQPAQRYPGAAALLAALEALNLEPARPLEDSDCTTTRLHVPAPAPRRPAWRAALVLLAVLLLGGGLAWWQWRPDPAVAAWLAQGEERLRQGRLSTPAGDSAAYYFRQVLARQPDQPEARRGLAEVARRHAEQARRAHAEGDLAAALEQVRLGLKAAPDDPALGVLNEEIPAAMARRHAERALKARTQGRLDEALDEVAKGLALKPDDAALATLRDDLRTALAAREAEQAARERARRLAQERALARKAAPSAAPAEKKGFFSRLFGR